MRKIILCIGLFLFLLTVALWAQPKTEIYRVKVKDLKSFDFKGIMAFSIVLPDKTAITVLGDSDLPIIKQLQSLDGKYAEIGIVASDLESLIKE